MIRDVYNKTGITATAGIGTNLYLAKVAMDIVAKHVSENEFGVRIAYLDELKYRKELEGKVAELEAKIKALEEENANLKKQLEGSEAKPEETA